MRQQNRNSVARESRKPRAPGEIDGVAAAPDYVPNPTPWNYSGIDYLALDIVKQSVKDYRHLIRCGKESALFGNIRESRRSLELWFLSPSCEIILAALGTNLTGKNIVDALHREEYVTARRRRRDPEARVSPNEVAAWKSVTPETTDAALARYYAAVDRASWYTGKFAFEAVPHRILHEDAGEFAEQFVNLESMDALIAAIAPGGENWNDVIARANRFLLRPPK